MLTVWVLARSDDPGLPLLRHAAESARLLVGDQPACFAAAPAPDALFVCSLGREEVEPIWALAPGVRWVHSRAAGVERLLFPALAASPAPLTNARGVFSRALAEFALAAMLFFAKDLRRLLRAQQEQRWEPFELDELAGRTAGIVGHGDIGRAVASRARALEMRVIALRRHPERSAGGEPAEEILPPERRLELMSRADYVVVSAPLTPETRGLVGEAEICAMRSDAVLINVGRGPVVDEAALLCALEARRIRGAALDVFEVEPLPAGHPFYRLDNVLLSPHCADQARGWLEGATQAFLENLERFRTGRPLLNLVDKARGY